MSITRRLVAGIGITFLAYSAFAGDGQIKRVGKPVAGRYIILLEDSLNPHVDRIADEFSVRFRGTTRFRWVDAVRGFSISIPEAAALAISRDPRVKLVEEVAELELSSNFPSPQTSAAPYEEPLSWNLDRIDQNPGGAITDESYSFCNDGAPVKVYVVDSGVRGDHREFWTSDADHTSRVQTGANFTGDAWAANDPCGVITQPATSDCQSTEPTSVPCQTGGHGTAVASIIAGKNFGVAKAATIWPVKVANCASVTGPSDQLLAGLNWIYQNHVSGPGVVNISLHYQLGSVAAGVTCKAARDADTYLTPSADETAIDAAVNNLIYYRSLTVVTSANNQNQDARCTTPARVLGGITVGGSTRPDLNGMEQRIQGTFGSNWGPAVDLFAPAQFVSSAAIWSNTARRTAGTVGTSFAAPHVSGVAARYLQNHLSASPGTVRNEIVNIRALSGVLNPANLNDPSSPNSTNNLLLNWNGCY